MAAEKRIIDYCKVVIRAASIAQDGLTSLSGWLSRLAYYIYQVGQRPEEYPFARIHAVCVVCRVTVKLLQKICEGLRVLFLYPEMDYNPLKQRLIDKRREIAGRLTGVKERKLTQILRDQIERNNAAGSSAKEGRATGYPINPGFGVVIPFYRHLVFLEDCLRSVATAAASLYDSELRVVIVNDDPEIDDAALRSRIPTELRAVTEILGNHGNIGISGTLNRGILASSQPFLLFLDCDDKIHPTSFEVLSQAIRKHPDALFLSSQMMLINDRDQFIAYHFRFEQVPDHARNMVASHLKVVRRDLFNEIGFHNPQYDGCQDYELALRTAIQKPIHLLPDFLYHFRWHRNTQGVSACARQAAQQKKISQVYRLVVSALTSGKSPIRIDGSGPFQDSWRSHLPRSTSSASLFVALPFTSDWTLPKMIYLLADVLGLVYSRYLDGDHAPLTISLPADYLDRLCSTCYELLPEGIS